MSRLLPDVIKRAKKNRSGEVVHVLDVGTGSGVFAIAAAKLGAAVTAIDISERACKYASHNAQLNQISLCKEWPTQGEQIAVHRQRFERLHGKGWRTEKEDYQVKTPFDVVILAPPYNPTWPGMKDAVAWHASAGALGQDAFRTQMKHLSKAKCGLGSRWPLVRAGSYVVGNHMATLSTDDKTAREVPFTLDLAERTSFMREVRAAFPGYQVEIVPILPTAVSIKHFLKSQYAGLAEGSSETAVPVQEWCEAGWQASQTGDTKDTHFTLFYFRIKVLENGQALEVRPLPWPKEDSHGRSWDDRIRLHRFIVEHAGGGVASTGSALVEGGTFFGGDADYRSFGNKPEEGKPHGFLHLVDKMLRREGLGEFFSAIIVDAAPVYPSLEGRKENAVTTAVWLGEERLEDSSTAGQPTLQQWISSRIAGGVPTYSEDGRNWEIRGDLLLGWLLTTRALQLSHCGPFNHPAFVGELARTQVDVGWPPVVYVESRELDTSQEQELDQRKAGHEYEHSLSKHVAMTPNASAEELHELIKRIRPLEGVAVTDLVELRAAAYLPNLERYRQSQKRYEEQVGLEESTTLRAEWARTDLVNCHRVMLRSLLRGLDAPLRKLGSDMERAVLVGSPVGLLYSRGSNAESVDDYPRTYRGGFWILAVPRKSQRRSLNSTASDDVVMERRVRYVWKWLWVLLSSEFGILNASEMAKYEGVRLQSAIGHEWKRYAGLLTKYCALQAKPAVDNVNLEVDFDCSEDVKATFGALSLRRDLRELIRVEEIGFTFVWSYLSAGFRFLNSLLGVDDDDLLPPQTSAATPMSVFVERCWGVARAAVLSTALREQRMDELSDVEALARNLRAFDAELQHGVQYKGPPTKCAEALLLDKKSERDRLTFLARWSHVLINIFVDCIRHGDTTRQVTLSIQQNESEEQYLLHVSWVDGEKGTRMGQGVTSVGELKRALDKTNCLIAASVRGRHALDILAKRLGPCSIDTDPVPRWLVLQNYLDLERERAIPS